MSKTRVVVSLSVFLFSISSLANYEVDRLMDSYLIAKADTQSSQVTDEQAKKTPYTIQVASYVNEKDAASHVEELRVQEKEVFYYPAFVRGTVWYKVCVGKFTEHTKAEEYRKKFVKRMDEPFSVVISLLERPTPKQAAKVAGTKTHKETTASTAQRKVASTGSAAVEPTESIKSTSATTESAAMATSSAITQSQAGVKTTKAEPTETVVKKMTPDTTPQVGTENFYSLQVGSFPNEKLAKDQLTKILSDASTETFVQEAQIDGKTWYRAFVGKFSNHKDAKEFQQSLSQKSPKLDSFIRKMK